MYYKYGPWEKAKGYKTQLNTATYKVNSLLYIAVKPSQRDKFKISEQATTFMDTDELNCIQYIRDSSIRFGDKLVESEACFFIAACFVFTFFFPIYYLSLVKRTCHWGWKESRTRGCENNGNCKIVSTLLLLAPHSNC